MKLTSCAFQHEGSIPSKYTCDGESISPPLEFADVPQEAKSLVLLMDDPDVPFHIRTDGMWDHWIVFNIPSHTTSVAEGKNPQGALGVNTSGQTEYGSPCPPDREHRYFFKLYALDTLLDLSAGATKAQVEAGIQGHVLVKAELIGRYLRK